MGKPFIPDDFEPPSGFAADGFRLEPLGPEHNERDHAAWMSSIEHIHATPGMEKFDWPVPMSLAENLAQIEGHAQEFRERKGFTYSVLDEDEIIGCVYVYPPDSGDHDAAVQSWVRASRAGMDVSVWRAVSAWLERDWPFRHPDYAPRT